jgi:hypothetical protein
VEIADAEIAKLCPQECNNSLPSGGLVYDKYPCESRFSEKWEKTFFFTEKNSHQSPVFPKRFSCPFTMIACTDTQLGKCIRLNLNQVIPQTHFICNIWKERCKAMSNYFSACVLMDVPVDNYIFYGQHPENSI